MRWSAVVLGIWFSFIVAASPAAGVTTVSAPASVAGPSSTSLGTDAVPLPTASPTRELAPSTPISLTFTLANPNSGELSRFLAQVEDPASASYRHFVTYPEFVEEFAPSASSVAHVEAALDAVGARNIAATPDRSAVTGVLPAASVEQLLGVDLVSYGSVGRMPLYTALGTASLPAWWNGLVASVGGLSDAATVALSDARLAQPPLELRPLSAPRAQFVENNSSGEDWFIGSDYTQAYGATELFPGAQSVPDATYPRSVAIATLLGSGFNGSTKANLPPWDPAVIDAYFNGTLGAGWPMPNFTGVPVTVNGVTPPLPGSFGDENDSTLFEVENSLDLEMAGSLAPGSSVYNFYFAGSLLASLTTLGNAADYFADDLAEALSYDYAPAHLATVSCSFGLPDLNDSLWNTELVTAAATGVTIVTASGDQGNAPDQLTGRTDGPWPVWPATAAWDNSGSVDVGGVSLSLSGKPNAYYNGTSLNLTYDAADGSIASASAWYDTLGGQGSYAGTEGGVSTVYPEPAWQFYSAAQPAVVNATITQGASSLGRTGPDVAMAANDTIATVYANSTETIFFTVLEGTSVAAPVLAGLLADVVAVENQGTSGPWTSLGFIDPEIYRFASFFAAFPGVGTTPFLDVTTGRNYAFSAAPGWDPTTGWGEVNAPAFLAADENLSLLRYVYPGPFPGLPTGLLTPSSGGNVPWPYIFAIFGVGIVMAIVLVAVAARTSRPRAPPPTIPWGAHLGGSPGPIAPGPWGTSPGATFLCPYCGAIRPSEPVRCPQCGAF